MRFCIWLTIASSATLFGAAPVFGQQSSDWPQFLGPKRNGVSNETGLNLDWTKNKPKLLWHVPLGMGYSSVAVVGQRLYTMAERQDNQFVVCHDVKSGKEIWSKRAAPGFIGPRRIGRGPRTTPTYNAGNLYCLMPAGELVCLKAKDGKILWNINIFDAIKAPNPPKVKFYWGMSGSPLVEGDLVIVQPGGPKNNSLAAFDKNSGKLIWSAGNGPPGYGSPIAINAAGKRQVVCTTGNSVLSVDPKTAKVLWNYQWNGGFNCNCATPIPVDGRLFISSAYGLGAALLDIKKKGAGLTAQTVWKNGGLQNIFGNSMIVGGHIYGFNGDLGAITLRCLDLKTGDRKWAVRAQSRATMIMAQKHLITLSERGQIQLIEANAQKFHLKGELTGIVGKGRTWAPPALAGGRLFLRDQRDLACVDVRAK